MRWLLLVLLASSTTLAEGFSFSDQTGRSGITYRNVCGAAIAEKGWLLEGMGAGAGWLDYDGDGNLDLYVLNGSSFDRATGEGEPNRLYRGDGTGKFTDVTEKAGVGHRGWGSGLAVGDIDNDGDTDLYVTNYGTNVLYRNRGDGTFEDVTNQAGVAGADLWSSSAAFFDMDLDGDLDLYVGNYMVGSPDRVPRRGSPAALEAKCTYRSIPVYCGPMGQVPLQDVLYRNDGDGTFTDVTAAAGVELKKPRFALGVVTADYDADGDQDIYVANDSVPNSLWRNDGDGTFTDVGIESLAALNADGRAQAGMGTDFGDYDRDGWLDLVVTNFAHDLNTVYRNVNGKFFIDDSGPAGLGVTNLALSWGTGFYDFDLDGDLDLFIANGHIYPEVDGFEIGTRFRQQNHLFLNQGAIRGRFKEVGATSGPGLAIARSFRGAAFADYDNDGDVDVFLTAIDDAGLLLRNDSPRVGRWLEVRLVGAKSNRDAIGARVTLTVAGVPPQIRERKGGGSYQSAADPRLHFGVGLPGGGNAKVKLEVRWPSGARDTVSDVTLDRQITIEEGRDAVN